MNILADAPRRHGPQHSSLNWWPATTSWIAVGFVVALILAVTVLMIFGVGEKATTIALRLTARWTFLLFWLAYAGGAMSKLFGPRFIGLARRGRDFGLAFAAAQLVHVALVLWLFYLAPGSNGGMLFFWIGIACTYLLALFSWPLLRGALGPRLWRICCEIALDYIMLVFAVDFIRIPLQEDGIGKYPLSYVPFAIMLVVGVGLRFAALARQQMRPRAISS
jgi:hypothetical protein